MFHAVAAVLILAWLFGFVTAHTAGGLLHILPVVALEFFVLQLIVGEDPVQEGDAPWTRLPRSKG